MYLSPITIQKLCLLLNPYYLSYYLADKLVYRLI